MLATNSKRYPSFLFLFFWNWNLASWIFAWVGPGGLEVQLGWVVVMDWVGCYLSTLTPGQPVRGGQRPAPRMNT